MEEVNKEEEVVYGEYKGYKTMSILKSANDKFPFSFGLAKAKLIVRHFEAIKKFVEANM